MSRHALDDPASVEYAAALDGLWAEWDGTLRECERVLEAVADVPARMPRFRDPIETCRATQYRAHVTSERALGLMPPLVVFEAHRYLVETLGYCRDALGALAAADEAGDELDADGVHQALQALRATREAYNAAHYASYAAGVLAAGSDSQDPVGNAGPPAWLVVTSAVSAATVAVGCAVVFMLLTQS